MDSSQITRGEHGQGDAEPVEFREGEGPTDATFNQWLTHHLHRLYDPVASEPLPADLIRTLVSRLK